MSEWQKKRISDLATFHRGFTWSSSQETNQPGPGRVPVLRIPNVQERLDTSDILYIQGVSPANVTRFKATKDWLLMVGSNGNPARVGDTVLIREDNDFLFASFLVGVEPSTNEGVDPYFLLYLMQSEATRKAIDDSIKGTTGLRNISLTHLAVHEFDCPPPAEQRKIARILTTLDELIEKTEALIAKYQAIKQGMMHDLFTRGVDEHGHLRPTYDEAPELYKESVLGWIPREWEVIPLGEKIAFITDYRGKTPPYSSHGIPALSAENIGGGSIKKITKHVSADVYRRWTTRGFPEPGDVIFTTEAPVGEVATLPGDKTYLLTRRVIAFRPDTEALRKGYLYWQLFREKRNDVWDRYVHGSTVPRILKPDVLGHPIRLPPPAEQDRIASALEACDTRIVQEGRMLSKLRLRKTGLMQDLLTGNVRVKVDEEDE